MTDEERMALVHAELDGDIGSVQRADLARLLLADPQVRALRDELQGICTSLGGLTETEPPSELKDSILNRLPSVPPAAVAPAYRNASFGRWRLANFFRGRLYLFQTLRSQRVIQTNPGRLNMSRKTVWVVGGLVLAIGAVAYLSYHETPAGKDAAGTIVAAKRAYVDGTSGSGSGSQAGPSSSEAAASGAGNTSDRTGASGAEASKPNAAGDMARPNAAADMARPNAAADMTKPH